MKIAIVSYSYTGNNKLLAETLAKEIKADHISIEDKRDVTVKSIMMDVIFHRKAKNIQTPELLKDYDFVIYMGPFWCGKIARPLLPFLRYHRSHNVKYGFITVSGGALGKNEKYQKELVKHTKHEPTFTHAFYTSDMMDKTDVKIKESGTYIISTEEASDIINQINNELF